MKRVFGVVAVLALLAAACGGEEAFEPDTGASTTATTPTVDAAPGEGLLALLALVPDGEGTRREVILNDYAAARAAAGIDPLPADADTDAIAEYAMALELGPPVPGSGSPPDRSPWMAAAGTRVAFGERYVLAQEEWSAEFGFGMADVEGDLSAGSPPGIIRVFAGSFDPGAVEAVLRADPVWGPDIEVVQYGDGSYFRWGEDYETNTERVSAARPLGRGGCLAVRDGVVIRTLGSGEMEAALDTLEGRSRSLADLSAVQTLAGALVDAGAYGAFLTLDAPQFMAPPDSEETVLAPYSALATGPGVAGDGTAFAVFAFLHLDEEGAAVNAGRLEEILASGRSARSGAPWSEAFDGTEVVVEGTVVVLTARRDGSPRAWLDVPFARDTLVLWSG